MTPDLDALLHRCFFFPAQWTTLAIYWWLGARDVRQTTRREPLVSRLLHLGPMMLAAAVLAWPRFEVLGLGTRFMPGAPRAFRLGAGVACAGLAFAIWARPTIGRNGSAIGLLRWRARVGAQANAEH